MKKFLTGIFFLLYLSSSLSFAQAPQAKVGDSFPLWTEGYLDVHTINTGKGESTFFILPDGTTLLVDAGAALSVKPWATDPKPDSSRAPGEWIARYINHMISNMADKKINYAVLSHFHWDHMGGVAANTKRSAAGAYKLSGITEVGSIIKIENLIDRGWPDYNWPVQLNDEKMKNYFQFVKFQTKNNGLKVSKINVGASDQIILKHKPEKYPDFQIRNLAANGNVWTGVGTNSRMYFPALKDLERSDYPPENKCSIAFRISYGKFDYFTGGDLDMRGSEDGSVSTRWKDIETTVAMVTGPVEALKANHHGNYEASSVPFLSILRPRVIIIQTWGASQPAMNTYRHMISKNVFPGPRDIFATNIMSETATAFDVSAMKSQQGHIVIRVNPGGQSYFIYVLDDANENFKIKSIFGPYLSS